MDIHVKSKLPNSSELAIHRLLKIYTDIQSVIYKKQIGGFYGKSSNRCGVVCAILHGTSKRVNSVRIMLRILIGVGLGFGLGVLACDFFIPSEKLPNDLYEFRYVPTRNIHTMRVYEDGSTVINYQDGTGVIFCLSNGLCQD